MSIQEINSKLRTILTQLMTIDYGQYMSPNEYASLQKYIGTVEKLLEEEEIGKEQFSEIVKEFSDIATDDATKSKSRDDGGFMAEDASLGMKLNISDRIKKLSEKLIKQEEVLNEYSQRFKPEDIIESKKEEIEVNKRVIEDYKEKISEINVFTKGPVYKKLKEAYKRNYLHNTTEELIKKLSEIESKMTSANDSSTKAFYEKQRVETHSKIKNAFEELGIQQEYSAFSDSSELLTKLNSTDTYKEWGNAKDNFEKELSRNDSLRFALGVDSYVGVTGLEPNQIRDLFIDKLNEYTNGKRELEEENKILNQHIATVQNSIDKRDIEVPTAMAKPIQPPEPTKSVITSDSRYKTNMNEATLRQMEIEFGNQYDRLPTSKSKFSSRMEFLKSRAEEENRKVPNVVSRFFSSIFKKKSIENDMREQYIGKKLETYVDGNYESIQRKIIRERSDKYNQQLADFNQNQIDRANAEQGKQAAEANIDNLRKDFLNMMTRDVINRGITDVGDASIFSSKASKKVKPKDPTVGSR